MFDFDQTDNGNIMKNIKLGFALIGLYLLSMPAMAVKIYECVDEAGNTTFESTCPPGTTVSGEKSFYTGKKKPDAGSPDIPVTLYTVPSCDACDVVKEVLGKYNAGFTEKNIENNPDLQKELQEKSGGGNTLSVPTVIIGEKVIVGFNKQSLTSSLEEAGFKTGESSVAPQKTSEPEKTGEAE